MVLIVGVGTQRLRGGVLWFGYGFALLSLLIDTVNRQSTFILSFISYVHFYSYFCIREQVK